MDFYDSLMEGYDEVEASQGMTGELLPTGYYALKVAKVLDKDESRNKVAMVRLQLVVTEGEFAKRSAFVSVSLNASAVDSKTDKERSPAELALANKPVQAMVKGLLKALKVTPGSPAGDGSGKLFNFYNVDTWEGREFIGRITVRPQREYQGKTYDAQNQLSAYHPLDDPKRGITWLRAKQGAAATDQATKAQTV